MERILVVDFIMDNLSLAMNMLAQEFEVATAISVEEASALIPDFKPDIVLISYVFPDSSGVDVLKTLTETNKKFVAMMMTSAKDMEELSDAILHGFDGFIRTPVVLDKFLEQLEKAKNINEMRINAVNYHKVKATKAMSITFSHYTRNLLTPLLGYLPSLKETLNDSVYDIINKNLNKINKLTYKLEELLEKEELTEYSYSDGTEYYEIDFEDD